MASMERDIFNEFSKRATSKGIMAAEYMDSAFARITSDVAYQNQKEIKQYVDKLQSILKEKGKGSCSLGRTAKNAETQMSHTSKLLYEMLNAEEKGSIGYKINQMGLRPHVLEIRRQLINKCEADQEFVLGFMKQYLKEGTNVDRIDEDAFEREQTLLARRMQYARSSISHDIPSVEDMLSSPENQFERGRLLEKLRGNRAARGWACGYSRFLQRGELEAARLYEAADFVAGRRRRSSRMNIRRSNSSKESSWYNEYYGAGPCINSSGVLQFSEDQKAIGFRYFSKAFLKSFGHDQEVNVVAREFRQNMKIQPAMDVLSGVERPLYQDAALNRAVEQAWNQSIQEPASLETLFQPREGMDGQIPYPDTIEVNPDLYYKLSKAWDESATALSTKVFTKPTRGLARQLEENADDAEEVAESLLRKAGRAVKRAGTGLLEFCRTSFLPMLGWIIKVGWPYFLVVETFLAMSHEKSGCYLEYLKSSDEVRGHPVKICDSVTWGRGLFSYHPNEAIQTNCQNCQQVYDTTLKPPWNPWDPPTNLMKNGCSEITDPQKKQCRKDRNSEGYNYRWDSTTWFECLMNTLTSFADDTASCVQCLTKIADIVFGGGLASLLGIIFVFFVLYILMYIYKKAFASTDALGGGGGPTINLSSSGKIS